MKPAEVDLETDGADSRVFWPNEKAPEDEAFPPKVPKLLFLPSCASAGFPKGLGVEGAPNENGAVWLFWLF